jgi:tetratricopeptide (TPR) repeat protein
MLPVIASLLFIAHPIQTQSVTYIVQRLASLAGLFYLSSMAFYLKYRLMAVGSRDRRGLFFALSIITALAAVFTKENTATLPLSIILLEWFFFCPHVRDLKKSLKALLPFLAILFIIPLSYLLHTAAVPHPARTMVPGAHYKISSLDYLLTQFNVIRTYIRLMILPYGQNLDYDFPVSTTLLHVPTFASFLFVALVIGLCVFMYKRDRLVSFGLCFFFLALSVESSVIPIDDVIFEHRLYLPSAGFILAFCGLVFIFTDRYKTKPLNFGLLLSGLIILLSVLTFQRNRVWHDDLSLWQDIVKKSPGKARAHNVLGLTYKDRGEHEKAIAEFKRALKADPKFYFAQNNLADLYVRLGRDDEAHRTFKQILKENPDFASAKYSLANFYFKRGDFSRAEQLYRDIPKRSPNYSNAQFTLGSIYIKLDKLQEAVQAFRVSLEKNPHNAKAHYRLGAIYHGQNNFDMAENCYIRALQLNPGYMEALFNLGGIYTSRGMLQKAEKAYIQALQLNPENAEAHFNLGNVYLKMERLDKSIQAYLQAVKYNDHHVGAYHNLGLAYENKGMHKKAAQAYGRAKDLRGQTKK